MSVSHSKVTNLAEGLRKEILKVVNEVPKKVTTLGSGLANAFSETRLFRVIGEINTDQLITMHHLPSFTANGHALRILIVEEKISKIHAIVVCGRKHLYELSPSDHLDKTLRLTRALVFIGVETFIHTSAIGGINPNKPGSIVLVTDHDGGEMIPLGLFSGNSSDVSLEEFGPQFFDCSNLYYSNIKNRLISKKGVLQWHLGPQFETPAQIKRLKTHNIAGVGMSMLPEAMAIQQLKLHSSGEYSNIKNIGIGIVANQAAGIGNAITHNDVKNTMVKASKDLLKLLSVIVRYH